MNIPDDKLRFAYYYILKHSCGYLEALKVIHPDIPDYFHSINYISTGIDAIGRERYKTTEEGYEHARVSYIAMSAKLYMN